MFKTNNEQFLVNKLNAHLIKTIRNTNDIQMYENILKEMKRARGEQPSKKMQFREYKQLTAQLKIDLRKKKKRVTNYIFLYTSKMNKRNLIMPRMYGTIKIHKEGHPIRPIVDTRNTVTGPLAEILAQILNPHKNKNVNIENTEDLIQKLQ